MDEGEGFQVLRKVLGYQMIEIGLVDEEPWPGPSEINLWDPLIKLGKASFQAQEKLAHKTGALSTVHELIDEIMKQQSTMTPPAISLVVPQMNHGPRDGNTFDRKGRRKW